MRFNDYHKNICATLKLEDPDTRREIRTYMLRLHGRGITINAAVPLVRGELERRRTAAEQAAQGGAAQT